MRTISGSLFSIFLLLLFLASGFPAVVVETDVCVYGGTSGGVTSAVQAARQGKTVSLAVFNNHVGGMTSGGLGATDTGNTGAIQGMSREFYDRIAVKYNAAAPKFTFEPKIAEQVFNEMLTEQGIVPRWNQRLASVVKNGQRITQIAMEDGTIYRARVFIDATYEGDLMAMAGVSFTLGRESTAQYGESLNGIRASTPAHQFDVPVDPYIEPGNAASGLLPFIQEGNGGTAGAADARMQAYNYRMCLTTNAANRNPIAAPPGYDESRYELLGRLITARINATKPVSMTAFMNIGSMPNSKTDINNNGAFSTDFIGENHNWASATYAERDAIALAHRNYIQGFFYYLGNSSRVPAATRSTVLTYGFPKDEFIDTAGWPHQLYVRECRRMVSDYVMQQQNCQGTRTINDSVGLGSYTMDSHNCQRVVQGGIVKNEGDVQSTTPQPYGIAYRSIVPKVGECENLLVPWSLSATHIAFGSIRMEPVFMILGQSAGSAAVIAVDDDVTVQQVSYAKLSTQLLADKQLLTWGTTASSGIIVDNTDTANVTASGTWVASSSSTGYWGADYMHDNSVKDGKTFRFTPNLPSTGEYDVYLRWTQNANRSANVPVDVIHASGTQTYTINQQSNGGAWVLLGRHTFNTGSAGSLLIRTEGTSAGSYVIADAARFVSPGTVTTTVQIVATDAVTREGAIDPARFTVLRTGDDIGSALSVAVQFSGTATMGSDVNSPATTVNFAAGIATATIPVQAIGDSLAEGGETVVATLQPGAGYTVGPVGSAQILVKDRPVDGWRFSHFSSAELGNPGISGNTADADGDGFTNLEEYVTARNPRSRDTRLADAEMANGTVQLSYNHRKAATDVVVTVEGSDNLTDWSSSGFTQEISRVDEGETERITIRLADPTPSNRGFLRLRITPLP